VATMTSPTPIFSPSAISDPNNILYSWKEMAVFLKCGVRTVQRWEKNEGLPVHRHLHWKRGTVYALKSELQEWLRSRDLADEKNSTSATDSSPLNNVYLPKLDTAFLYALCEQARARAERARRHFAEARAR
jgi:phage terminase Nu1 subunit (DNA packaging protein)